ncbi:MAG: hypothetical protein GYB67_12540 [Chloroflexi bacterium]|nr:hypothetical protein [Chloroflexota bacterium]
MQSPIATSPQTELRLFGRQVTVPRPLVRAVALGLLIGLGWWIVGLVLRATQDFFVWGDQLWTFTLADVGFLTPYDLPGFVNTPWTLIPLLPLSYLPFELAVLAQMLIYYGALAAIIVKFGRPSRAAKRRWLPHPVVIVLASPLALDAALNLNIDWIVCLGLLVPPLWSGPFLLAKPQLATGYILSFSRRDLVRWLIVVLITGIISLLIWGPWPLDLLESFQRYEVAWGINMAPMALLPAPIGVPVSIGIGVLLAVFAVRRRDALLGVLAGLFFVPYVASYSLLLPFALITARLPRVGLLVTVSLWLIVAVLAVSL